MMFKLNLVSRCISVRRYLKITKIVTIVLFVIRLLLIAYTRQIIADDLMYRFLGYLIEAGLMMSIFLACIYSEELTDLMLIRNSFDEEGIIIKLTIK